VTYNPAEFGCEVCDDPEPCSCDEAYEDEYGYEACDRCGGTGEYVPEHCCHCGGSPYCVGCITCGARSVGSCKCPIPVSLQSGQVIL
jgi:hypothetical protein